MSKIVTNLSDEFIKFVKSNNCEYSYNIIKNKYIVSYEYTNIYISKNWHIGVYFECPYNNHFFYSKTFKSLKSVEKHIKRNFEEIKKLNDSYLKFLFLFVFTGDKNE